MPEEYERLEDYVWYPPEEVLTVRDADDLVIAFGVLPRTERETDDGGQGPG